MKNTQRRGVRWAACAALVPMVLGGSVVSVAAAHAAETLPEPVLKYTFDDAASSGTVQNSGSGGPGLDGIVKDADSLQRGEGATAATGTSGVFPGAPIGTKNSPHVQIPAGLFGDAEALTVSTWIKWDGRFANELPWSYIVGGDGVPANNWGVYYQPTEDGKAKAVANSGAEVKAEGPPLQPDTWTHITTVAGAGSVSYYVNGALVGSEDVPFDVGEIWSANSTFSGLLGRTQWTGDYAAFFPGEFDDFTVYDSALNSSQVSALFTEYSGTITAVEPSSVSVSTPAGQSPTLPSTARATYSGGSQLDVPITWASIPASAYATEGASFSVVGSITGWDGRITANVTVSTRETETVAVDFSQETGEFRGGASGTLYGLGDETSPTQALVNGAAMTTISQKPPFGTQHPGGDSFNVEDTFFEKWGEELYVYAQDYYPDWPYHGDVRPGDDFTFLRDEKGAPTGAKTAGANGVWDYLEVLESVADEIATNAADPSKFVFIPFNEPEWIWYDRQGPLYRDYLIYGGQEDSFTPDGVSDWKAAWDVITAAYARHGLDRPDIAGPGDSIYMGEADMTEFMTQAKKDNAVPDVYVWHELGGYAWLPDRMDGFRRAAAAAGIAEADVPRVNITEYGSITDMSTPASLLHWFSSFEAAKVDAQTAYWTASGTMSDNQALVNSANGGWWLFKWYGDMHGSQTVKVTQNEQNAIAAIDAENKRAQVLLGSIDTGKDAVVRLDNLDPAVFGANVDIEVRENRVTGTDGQADVPRVVAAADDVSLSSGSLSIDVPSSDWTSAYQVVVTPATDRDVEAAVETQAASYAIEAENTALTAARVRTTPGDSYHASGDDDVFDFVTPSARSEWAVDVAQDGLYRLQIIGAAPGVPAQHALFVDDVLSQRVQYGATSMKPGKVQSTARSSAEVYVQLTAGSHTLSLRASEDGTTLLPNAGYEWGSAHGVTLDRYTLTRVGDTTNTERREYPASTFRLAEGATLVSGGASIGSGQRADLYPTVLESGYYDIEVDWASSANSTLEVRVNGRTATTFGAGDSRVRVHLPLGVSEVELFGSDGVSVTGVATQRAADADQAIVRVEAEDASKVTLGGSAKVTQWGDSARDGVATNGSGSGFVTGLGITDADPANEGTMTVARGAGFAEAGEYDAILHYSNDSIEGTHSYNPQVVDAGLQAKEGTSSSLAGRSTFRYTYLASNFFEANMQLTLAEGGAPIEFGNTRHTLYIDEKGNDWASDDVAVDGYAVGPNVDWIAFAPFVLESEGGQASAPAAPVAPTVAVKRSTATVSWSAPADGGSAITSYDVSVIAADGAVAKTASLATGLGAENSISLTGLSAGKYTARVVAKNAVGASEASASSTVFTIAKRFTAATTTISGSVVVGKKVTASVSSTPGATKKSYQWYLNGKKVAGATSSSYTVKKADGGKKLTVVVTLARSGYNSSTVTSAAKTVLKAFTAVAKPRISGSVVVGRKVTASVSSTPGATKKSYQWYLNGKKVAGATSSSYTVKKADGGKKLTVVVTLARSGYDSTRVTSAAKTVVKVFTSVAKPKISGSVVVGKKVTATVSSAPGATGKSYQWYINGKKVAGATKATYYINRDDAGKRISVTATVARNGYQKVVTTSTSKRVAR